MAARLFPTTRPISRFESGAILVYLAEKFGAFLQVQAYSNVQRWTDQIAARPAVKRGRRVNRTWGEPDGQLAERHDASDF